MSEIVADEEAAFHEAGHAVVANALRHGGIEARLGADPTAIWDPWDDPRAERRHHLIISMAGLEAECLRFGDCVDHHHRDDAIRGGYSLAEAARLKLAARSRSGV